LKHNSITMRSSRWKEFVTNPLPNRYRFETMNLIMYIDNGAKRVYIVYSGYTIWHRGS
jgi:hypothetical protein